MILNYNILLVTNSKSREKMDSAIKRPVIWIYFPPLDEIGFIIYMENVCMQEFFNENIYLTSGIVHI